MYKKLPNKMNKPICIPNISDYTMEFINEELILTPKKNI